MKSYFSCTVQTVTNLNFDYQSETSLAIATKFVKTGKNNIINKRNQKRKTVSVNKGSSIKRQKLDNNP